LTFRSGCKTPNHQGFHWHTTGNSYSTFLRVTVAPALEDPRRALEYHVVLVKTMKNEYRIESERRQQEDAVYETAKFLVRTSLEVLVQRYGISRDEASHWIRGAAEVVG